MEKTKTKGCLVECHSDGYIGLQCVDKDCKKISRTLCSQCFIESENNHNECQDILSITDLNNLQLIMKNKSFYDIQSLYDDINTYETELIDKIEEKYDQLLQNFAQKVNEIKKSKKLEVMQVYFKVKEEMKTYLHSQLKFKDLEHLQKQLYSFKEGNINIEELNRHLTEKQQENTEKSQKIQIIDTYKTIKEQKFYNEQILDLQQKLDNFLEKQNIFTQKFTQIQMQFKPFEHYKSQYICGKNTYFTKNGCGCLKSAESFKINQKIRISFSYSRCGENNPSIYIGITSQASSQKTSNPTFNDGNHIRLESSNSFKQSNSFKKLGNKNPNEVFESGQIYHVDMCVQENIFRISTEDEQCIMENQYEFEKGQEDWIFFFYTSQYVQISIL